RSGSSDHLHDLSARRSAHDGIVDQNDTLSGKEVLNGIQFHLHAEMADLGFWFDEGPADVVIPNQTKSEWDPGFLRVADSSGNTGIRNRNDEVRSHRILLRPNTSHQIPARLNRASDNDSNQPPEVD